MQDFWDAALLFEKVWTKLIWAHGLKSHSCMPSVCVWSVSFAEPWQGLSYLA